VLDGQGRVLPDDKTKIRLSVAGPAELVGFGSANPFAVGSFQSPVAETFRGRALAILRSRGARGTVRIEASSEGLRGTSASIQLV
jgi:beta-galactosidase